MKFQSSFKLAFISMIFFFVGCISGPKDPHQGLSEKLSGDSYDSIVTIAAVPILHRKIVPRKLSGRVLCADEVIHRVAHRGEVSISNEQKIIGSTSIQIDGTYTLTAPMLSKTDYYLKAVSTCGAYTETISFSEKARTEYDILLKK